jgi:hypothetical protein
MDARFTFAMGETGRVLDRLCALEKIISSDQIEQVVRDSGLTPKRSHGLTPSIMLWVVLAMGIFTDAPIRQVFRNCRRFHKTDVDSPSRSALCHARQRLGITSIRMLFILAVVLQCCPEVEGGFYKDYRLMSFDGSVYTTPDTEANEKAFGRPQGGSSSESQGGFPQVGKVSLMELGSHVEYRIVLRSMRRGESTMAQRLVKHLTPDMLLLLDAGFFGFDLWNSIMKQGSQILGNVSSTPLLTPVRTLSDGSYLTKIYETNHKRKADRDGVWVRVLKYTLNDPQRTGHGQIHRLVTTLLDENKHPAMELITLYHERWEHELIYDEQKTHQDPRRASKPTHLRSETPAGVVQEMYALSIAHFVVRKSIFDAARKANLDPDRISFTGAFHILRTRLPECASVEPKKQNEWYENLLSEIATEKLEPRRNRINPRVVKRARCKWTTKKPEHYGLKPLRQTFLQTVVMT